MLRLLSCILIFWLSPSWAQAFVPSVEVIDANTVVLKWQIDEQAYLYKDSITITPLDQGIAHLGSVHYPQGLEKSDAVLGTYAIYRKKLQITVPLLGIAPGRAQYQIAYQGCTDKGYCYPPVASLLTVTIDQNSAVSAAHLSSVTPDLPEVLVNQHWLWASLVFYGLGLLLAATPCILPMIPILSGIIIGHGPNLTTGKAFRLSLVYVLAMAGTYALIGMAMAQLGENLQTTLQRPWVMLALAGLFLLLALAMFGVYEFRLPTRWQAALARINRRQPHGTYVGVAVMGMLSVLILSPCVTPPLVGALSYITTTGDTNLGALALFMLGLGIGTPLLLIGAAAGKYLPKAGRWMQAVQTLVGIVLLGMAMSLAATGLGYTLSKTGPMIHKLATLNATLSEAKVARQPVLLVYYANWCVNCKIMERSVLSNPTVQTRLHDFRVVTVDITANDRDAKAMSSKFNIIAPPTYVFLDSHGVEVTSARVVGLVGVAEFLKKCSNVY